MLSSPSLIKRIVIGKSIGLLVGLSGFFLAPYFYPDISLMMQWGFLFWYTTLGAVIAVFGVLTYHPFLNLAFPWWVRGPFLGAWFNFMLTLLMYDALADMMVTMFEQTPNFASPFWFVLEGALIGLLIDFLATRWAGEGKKTADELIR